MTQIFALIGGAVAIGIALLVVLYGAAALVFWSLDEKETKER